MGKIVFLFISIILCSCASDEPISQDVIEDNIIDSRSPQEALESAKQAAAFFYPSKSRSQEWTASIDNVIPIHSQNSRNADKIVFYAVNFDNNQGFVLVNASKNGAEIIGVSDSGSYNALDRMDC